VCRELPITDEERSGCLRYFLADSANNTTAAGVLLAIIKKAKELDADSRYELESFALTCIGRAKKYDKPFTKK
jgi:hypothetical protein